jgi:hypothetical protein
MVTVWIATWKIVLILTLAAFAVMTVFVTVGGAVDIRDLFRQLRAAEEEREQVL